MATATANPENDQDRKTGRLETAQEAERERLENEELERRTQAELAEQQEAEEHATRQREGGRGLDRDRLDRAKEKFDQLRGKGKGAEKLGEKGAQAAEKGIEGIGRAGQGLGQAAEGVAGLGEGAAAGAEAAGALGSAVTTSAGAQGLAATGMATGLGAAGGATTGAAAAASVGTAGTAVAAGTAPAWLVPVLIIIGLAVAGLLIIFVVMALSLVVQSWQGNGGRQKTEEPKHVVESAIVLRIKALTNDLKAKSELLEQTSQKILDAFIVIERDIKASKSKSSDEILAQLETTRQAVQKLQAAVKKSSDNPPAGNNKKKLPQYVIDARTEALTEMDKLTELLKGLQGSGNERIVQVALEEVAKAPQETNGDNRPVYADGSVAPYNINDKWCASFVNWVYRQAYPTHPTMTSTISIWGYMKDNHYTFEAGEDTPRPGDIFWAYGGDGFNHVGIVTGVSADGKMITTAEGNFSQGVNTDDKPVGGSSESKAWRFARMRN